MKICVTADTAICNNTKWFLDQIVRNIEAEMERMKDVPVPIVPAKEKD